MLNQFYAHAPQYVIDNLKTLDCDEFVVKSEMEKLADLYLEKVLLLIIIVTMHYI
ncbi:MAG: hypothetical protein LBT10_06160 [Methanobrevibacter sp.]|jgi:hypothetical protein|nr:hypothetical protein [Methanobrevibacter sp.]